MRSHLQQKIQPACCGTEPRPQNDVGELPPAQQADSALPHGVDSPPPDQECRSVGCDEGAGNAPCRSRCPEGKCDRNKCSFPAGLLILLIKLYQKTLSPLLPQCCRFYPTCSHYAVEALRTHGFMGGFALMVWRVLRCNPWCPGGYDPVPPPKSGKKHNEVR